MATFKIVSDFWRTRTSREHNLKFKLFAALLASMWGMPYCAGMVWQYFRLSTSPALLGLLSSVVCSRSSGRVLSLITEPELLLAERRFSAKIPIDLVFVFSFLCCLRILRGFLTYFFTFMTFCLSEFLQCHCRFRIRRIFHRVLYSLGNGKREVGSQIPRSQMEGESDDKQKKDIHCGSVS